MVYKRLKKHLSSLLSRQCLLCLSPTNNRYLLCSFCEDDFPKNDHYCVVCSIPLYEESLTCGKCQNSNLFYETSLIPFIYATPIKQLISQLKFHSNLTYAPLLAECFLQRLMYRKNNLPECIIPVPLHTERLRERGFNQALELAQLIGTKLNIPVDYKLSQRHKITPFQSGLSAKQRKLNLKNAFSIKRTHQYKHVAIFDDVVTTGVTVNELAKQLKQSGVEIIEVWAIARTSI